jgi:TonB family protein
MKVSIRVRLILAMDLLVIGVGVAVGWAGMEVTGRAIEHRLVDESARNAAGIFGTMQLPLSDTMLSRLRQILGAEVADFPAPEYPPQSRGLGEEGFLLLEVEILPDGRAGKVRVLHDPGYPRLVAAAVEAVRKATFKPAMKSGAATRSVVEVPIRFRLQ